MQDLARLLSGQDIHSLALATGKGAQRTPGRFNLKRQQHSRCPDAVPTEKREVPRRARRKEAVLGRVPSCHPQRPQILERPLEPRLQPIVGATGRIGPLPERDRQRCRHQDSPNVIASVAARTR